MKQSGMERAFFTLYEAVGLFCLIMLVISSSPRLFKIDKLPETYFYGNLYKQCMVTDFKIPREKQASPGCCVDLQPIIDAAPKHDINGSRVIFYGDSYFHKHFSPLFEKLTGVPSFSRYGVEYSYNPWNALGKTGLIKDVEGKVLILESSERFIIRRFMHDETRNDNDDVNASQGTLDRINKFIKSCEANPYRMEFMLRETRVFFKLFELRNTWRFHMFGSISPFIGSYGMDPPVLFHSNEVDFFHQPKKDADLDRAADNIARLRLALMKRYNLRMVFMPVPNRYALYGNRLLHKDEKYDDFLPRLFERLDARGVPYINLYEDFNNSPELLYYLTDTHWNQFGMNIALSKVADAYREMGGSTFEPRVFPSSTNQH